MSLCLPLTSPDPWWPSRRWPSRCPVPGQMPQIILPVRQRTSLRGTGYRLLALGTKEHSGKRTSSSFQGWPSGLPCYLPQGKAKNISYGCGPRGHLTRPFNMVPSTEMSKLALKEGWEEKSNRCGGCPAPIVSLHHKLDNTTRNTLLCNIKPSCHP